MQVVHRPQAVLTYAFRIGQQHIKESQAWILIPLQSQHATVAVRL
jgi:hypothetical protein